MPPPGLPHCPFRNELSLRVKTTFTTFALFVAGVLLPMSSQATGFGAAQGEAVIGTPLSVEIELINPERDSLECFEIKPLGEEGDSSFFPRRARLDLRKSADGKTYLVVMGGTIREPVVEFRLRTSCGTQIERRYTLLASPPRELLPATVALPVTSSSPITSPPRTDTVKSASLPHGLTLDQLARQRYPLQPKARAKFKRLMKSANPDLALADDEVLPVDPSSLNYPENLPKRRTGPYRPANSKKKATLPQTSPPAKNQAAVPAPPPCRPTSPSRATIRSVGDRFGGGGKAPGGHGTGGRTRRQGRKLVRGSGGIDRPARPGGVGVQRAAGTVTAHGRSHARARDGKGAAASGTGSLVTIRTRRTGHCSHCWRSIGCPVDVALATAQDG